MQIKFYSFDFAYNSEKSFKIDVVFDKTGKQIYTFKAVDYNVTVKALDNNGLENVKLRINAVIKLETYQYGLIYQ